MLEFEFIQPGEFEDPYYEVTICGEIIGGIEHHRGEWGLDWFNHMLFAFHMDQISAKLKELNKKGSK